MAVEARWCAHCGTPLFRKRYGATLEDRGRFSQRKYCDAKCCGADHTKADPTLAAHRKRAVALRGPACQRCGSTQMVCAHHLDEDPTNNVQSNVMTLCGSCHTKWHWEHGKVPNQKKSTTCCVCGRAEAKISRGMCGMHYQRWRKYGDPMVSRPPLR